MQSLTNNETKSSDAVFNFFSVESDQLFVFLEDVFCTLFLFAEKDILNARRISKLPELALCIGAIELEA